MSKSINGRLLRPKVCSCTYGCRSREEMRRQHGDPEAFLEALENAFASGTISFDEAERANLKYRAEWHEAPEHSWVDKGDGKDLSEGDRRVIDKIVGMSGHSPENVRKALDWLVSGKKPGER